MGYNIINTDDIVCIRKTIMYYVDNNKRIVTKLENVISINSLVALVRSSHGNMVKDLTSRHNFWQFVYCQSGQCTWNIEGDLYITKKREKALF